MNINKNIIYIWISNKIYTINLREMFASYNDWVIIIEMYSKRINECRENLNYFIIIIKNYFS